MPPQKGGVSKCESDFILVEIVQISMFDSKNN